jgi:hypothetical protein
MEKLSMTKLQLCIIALCVISTSQARGQDDSHLLEEYGFDLRDIERKCEVYRYSDNYGELDCRGNIYNEVERKCDVFFFSGSDFGDIDCRGSDFRVIERNCDVFMYTEQFGEIDC